MSGLRAARFGKESNMGEGVKKLKVKKGENNHKKKRSQSPHL